MAEGCKLGLDPEQKKVTAARLGAALPVLEQGGKALLTLADLGADLGSVTQGELRRIQRGLDAHSYWDAELAARHLAARLRRPKPSFSSAGGGGVESGGGQGSGRGGQRRPTPTHKVTSSFPRNLSAGWSNCPSTKCISLRSKRNRIAVTGHRDPELDAMQSSARRAASRLRSLPDYTLRQTPADQRGPVPRSRSSHMPIAFSLSLK